MPGLGGPAPPEHCTTQGQSPGEMAQVPGASNVVVLGGSGLRALGPSVTLSPPVS
jgi:hypothetical protein